VNPRRKAQLRWANRLAANYDLVAFAPVGNSRPTGLLGRNRSGAPSHENLKAQDTRPDPLKIQAPATAPPALDLAREQRSYFDRFLQRFKTRARLAPPAPPASLAEARHPNTSGTGRTTGIGAHIMNMKTLRN